jgi:hypothetical protein
MSLRINYANLPNLSREITVNEPVVVGDSMTATLNINVNTGVRVIPLERTRTIPYNSTSELSPKAQFYAYLLTLKPFQNAVEIPDN